MKKLLFVGIIGLLLNQVSFAEGVKRPVGMGDPGNTTIPTNTSDARTYEKPGGVGGRPGRPYSESLTKDGSKVRTLGKPGCPNAGGGCTNGGGINPQGKNNGHPTPPIIVDPLPNDGCNGSNKPCTTSK